MTQARSCRFCQYWQKHPHKEANWGECSAAQRNSNDSQLHMVWISSLITEAKPHLATRDVFYCASFSALAARVGLTDKELREEHAQPLREHRFRVKH